MLSRAEQAGGKVVMPKTKLSDEVGYIAMFMDSEVNKAGFTHQLLLKLCCTRNDTLFFSYYEGRIL